MQQPRALNLAALYAAAQAVLRNIEAAAATGTELLLLQRGGRGRGAAAAAGRSAGPPGRAGAPAAQGFRLPVIEGSPAGSSGVAFAGACLCGRLW